MAGRKPIQNMKQARVAFVELIAALDLKVDAGAIFDAVQVRGFKRARAFSVSLAAASQWLCTVHCSN